MVSAAGGAAVKQTAITFIKDHWKYILGAILVIVLFVFINYEYQQWKSHLMNKQDTQPIISVNTAGERSKPGETQVVYLQGQSSHTQEIVYIPKEVNPATGQQEKTDVQFDKKDNKVYVKVNGKEFEVPANVTEDAKFENGKLVVTEQTEMRINVTAPKPYLNLGLGWSKDGPAAQLNGPLYKNVSWWAYGDKKTVAGGVQFPIMK